MNGAATTRLGRLRAASGHEAPYGVRIWGVGNEMYGPWQWGHMSITQYLEKHNLMVRAMRKVDPTIRVIASGATPEEASWCYSSLPEAPRRITVPSASLTVYAFDVK